MVMPDTALQTQIIYPQSCVQAASTGVTPFASIVRQLAAEFRFAKCAHCNKVRLSIAVPYIVLLMGAASLCIVL